MASSNIHRLSWMAALGLACIASSAALRRRVLGASTKTSADATPIPDKVYRCASELQRNLFSN